MFIMCTLDPALLFYRFFRGTNYKYQVKIVWGVVGKVFNCNSVLVLSLLQRKLFTISPFHTIIKN